jgi:hypothetical protein
MQGRVRLPGLVALLAMAAFGQNSASTTSTTSTTSGIASVAGGQGQPAPPGVVPSFSGAPYSAEVIEERVHTLPDGSEVVEPWQKSRVYRDSAGRTRTERFPRASASDGQPSHALPSIYIADTVAHVGYSLDPAAKVTHRRAVHTLPDRPAVLPRPAGNTASTTTVVAAARFPVTLEHLGDKTIEGVRATGTRRTITFPVGSRGNDQPMVSVREMWVSREMHIILLTEVHDPVRGIVRQKMTHISRAEPDPRLFQPPLDYAITDEPVTPRVAPRRVLPVPETLASAERPAIQEQTEPVPQPEPAPAETISADEPAVDAAFADAPPDEIPPDADSPPAYVGVNAVYVGVSHANPSVKAAAAGTSKTAPAAGTKPPAPPKRPKPKVPPPDQPVK